jgi:hypothetical protein
MRASRFFVALVAATAAGFALPAVAAAFALVPVGTPVSRAQMISGADRATWIARGDETPPREHVMHEQADGRVQTVVSDRPLAAQALPIGAARDGATWFYDAAGSSLQRIAADGVVSSLPIPVLPADRTYTRMTVGPDGRPWFTRTTAYNSDGTRDEELIHLTEGGLERKAYTVPVGAGADDRDMTVDRLGRAWMPHEHGALVVPPAGRVVWHPIADKAEIDISVGRVQGGLWFVDRAGRAWRMTAGGRVHRLATSTALRDQWGSAIEGGGALWILDSERARMLRLAANGRLSIHRLPKPRWLGDPGVFPVSMAADARGRVWVAQPDRVARVDPTPACQVPALRRTTAVQARRRLADAGCRVRVVRPQHSRGAALRVARQGTSAGHIRPPGTRITIVLTRVSTICLYDRTKWRRVLTTDAFALYERETVDDNGDTTVLEACTLANGRRWKVDTGYSDFTSDSGWGSFVVHGPWLVYESGGGDQYSSGESIVVVNVVKRTKDFVPGSSSEFGVDSARLRAWAVNDDGVVATIREVQGGGDSAAFVTEVDTVRPGHPPHHHATAPTEGSAFSGLALDATSVHWTQDGTAHVDPIGG